MKTCLQIKSWPGKWIYNNEVGRRIFEDCYNNDIDIVSVLRTKMEQAVKVSQPDDIEKAKHQLVFIED